MKDGTVPTPTELLFRLVAFLRPLMPAQRLHFLVLLGLLLLLCVPHLSFWQAQPSWEVREAKRTFSSEELQELTQPRLPTKLQIVSLRTSVLLFYSVALVALKLLFSRVEQPSRHFLSFVLVPSVFAGLLQLFGNWHLKSLPHSVFEKPATDLAGWTLLPSEILMRLGPAVWCLLLGLISLGIGFFLEKRGPLKLPIRFVRSSHDAHANAGDDENAEETLRFVFLALLSVPVFSHLFGLLFSFVSKDFFRSWSPFSLNAFSLLVSCLSSAIPFLIAVILSRNRAKGIWLPPLRKFSGGWVALALALPVTAEYAARAATWFAMHVRWELFKPDVEHPLPLTEFFAVPPAWGLLFLFPAFIEELSWRVYFQPRMVNALGVRRGLLLLGFVWGFWHFPVATSYFSLPYFLGDVGKQLALTVTMTAALGWFFLRTQSVWPVTLFHFAYDWMLSLELRDLTPTFWPAFHSMAQCGFIVLIAFVLFHRWPVRPIESAESPPESSDASAGNR